MGGPTLVGLTVIMTLIFSIQRDLYIVAHKMSVRLTSTAYQLKPTIPTHSARAEACGTNTHLIMDLQVSNMQLQNHRMEVRVCPGCMQYKVAFRLFSATPTATAPLAIAIVVVNDIGGLML